MRDGLYLCFSVLPTTHLDKLRLPLLFVPLCYVTFCIQYCCYLTIQAYSRITLRRYTLILRSLPYPYWPVYLKLVNGVLLCSERYELHFCHRSRKCWLTQTVLFSETNLFVNLYLYLKNIEYYIRLDVFTLVKMWIVAVCVVMQCNGIGGYECFSETRKIGMT